MYHVDSDVVLDTCFLINYHMMPFNWDTDKAKQRWKERFGEYKYKILLDSMNVIKRGKLCVTVVIMTHLIRYM